MNDGDKEMDFPNDSKLYVLGRLGFSAEVLALVLKRELGIECANVVDYKEIGVDLDSNTVKHLLVLIDGSQVDFETTILQIQSFSSDLQGQQVIVGLYNLPQNSGVERRAFAKGIHGFFYQTDNLKHMLRGIVALLKGEVWVSRDLLVEFAIKGSTVQTSLVREQNTLTEREMQVLALVSIGASNEEIAEKLFVSTHTVKTHLYNIFKKIKVPNRFQAALWDSKNI